MPLAENLQKFFNGFQGFRNGQPLQPGGMSMETIRDLLERTFSLHQTRMAIRIYDKFWTYRDLENLSNKISGLLLKSGIKKGDRVVVLMNKSIYLYGAIVGIIRSGGVCVPMDVRTPPARLTRILEDICPFYLFIDRHSFKHYQACETLSNHRFGALYLDDNGEGSCKKISFKEESMEDRRKFPSLSSEDLALILFTSGSTGVPKGAMLTHGNLYNILSYTVEAFDYKPGEVGSALNTNGFDMSMAETLTVLCSGGTLGVYPEEILFQKDVLELTYDYGVTKMFLLPSTLRSLVESNLIQPKLLNELKDVHLGGESIPVNMLIKMMNLLPQARFHNSYGPTETAFYTSLHTFRRPLNVKDPIFPIGFPVAHNRFILDRTDFPGEQNKGELIIVGPQVGLGYWNDPERTRTAFGVTDRGERYYRTGDVASFDPEVGYFIHGRKDHQIKFMGYRIELGEIEQVLSLLPSVKENVVIPVYVNDKIKELRLIYSDETDSDKEIRKHLSRNLPSYMIPRSIIRVESLPKNQNNKIDRAMIKEMYGRK
jgi:amino acid adenylation domain-containing protein